MAGVTLAFAAPRRGALFPPRRGGRASVGGSAGAGAAAVGAVPIPALVPSRTRLPGRGQRGTLAAAIPGNSVVESVTVGGFANFFGIYGNLLIARVLLSWFPAAQVCWERCGGSFFFWTREGTGKGAVARVPFFRRAGGRTERVFRLDCEERMGGACVCHRWRWEVDLPGKVGLSSTQCDDVHCSPVGGLLVGVGALVAAA